MTVRCACVGVTEAKTAKVRKYQAFLCLALVRSQSWVPDLLVYVISRPPSRQPLGVTVFLPYYSQDLPSSCENTLILSSSLSINTRNYKLHTMAGPRASSGQLRTRIRRQSSITPPSAMPSAAPPGPAPKIRLESLKEDVQFSPVGSRPASGAGHAVAV